MQMVFVSEDLPEGINKQSLKIAWLICVCTPLRNLENRYDNGWHL